MKANTRDNSQLRAHEVNNHAEQANVSEQTGSAQNEPPATPITKGETYGVNYTWAVDVTLPEGWNEEKDRDFMESNLRITSREGLVDHTLAKLEDYHFVLTHAYKFLTGQPFEPYDCIFQHLPVVTKVAILQKLFRQRSQDSDYLKLFDGNLRRFLDVDQICMPLLEKHILAPEEGWFWHLVSVSEIVTTTVMDFEESLVDEHDNCPRMPCREWIQLAPGTEESCASPDRPTE